MSIDGRVQLRLAEGEAQLGKVRDLVGLPAGRLEQDRGADAPVDVAQRPLGVGVERLAVRLLAGDVGVDRRDEPRLAELAQHDAAEPGSASGAEPSVISGSVRALRNASCAASEIHWASIASVPRVCWYCGSDCHLRWKTESVAGWNG